MFNIIKHTNKLFCTAINVNKKLSKKCSYIIEYLDNSNVNNNLQLYFTLLVNKLNRKYDIVDISNIVSIIKKNRELKLQNEADNIIKLKETIFKNIDNFETLKEINNVITIYDTIYPTTEELNKLFNKFILLAETNSNFYEYSYVLTNIIMYFNKINTKYSELLVKDYNSIIVNNISKFNLETIFKLIDNLDPFIYNDIGTMSLVINKIDKMYLFVDIKDAKNILKIIEKLYLNSQRDSHNKLKYIYPINDLITVLNKVEDKYKKFNNNLNFLNFLTYFSFKKHIFEAVINPDLKNILKTIPNNNELLITLLKNGCCFKIDSSNIFLANLKNYNNIKELLPDNIKDKIALELSINNDSNDNYNSKIITMVKNIINN